MDKRKSMLTAGVLLLIVATVCALGLFRTNPALAELQRLSEKMSESNLSDDERTQLRTEFRAQLGSLSDAQREAFFNANRDRWMGRAEQRMDEFFAMSPADQRQRLDEMIDRMRQPRTERPNRGERGNRGGMTEAQRDERSKRRLDRTSPKMRAQFAEFRRQLDDRAKQRGITNLPDRGSWGGRQGR